MTYETEGKQPCPECGHLHYYGHGVYAKCRVCECWNAPDLDSTKVSH